MKSGAYQRMKIGDDTRLVREGDERHFLVSMIGAMVALCAGAQSGYAPHR